MNGKGRATEPVWQQRRASAQARVEARHLATPVPGFYTVAFTTFGDAVGTVRGRDAGLGARDAARSIRRHNA
jgi:hypothetical protein